MEENKETQLQTEEKQESKPSTEAGVKNVPYDRFQEVVQSKNDMAQQVGKLQAQIDKMNLTQKQKEEAKLVEDGKLKEALDIVTKERDQYKKNSDAYDLYQSEKRESLMNKLTNDDDKSIAEDLSLIKLETYVNKVVNVNSPSTSQARASSKSAGDFGGYSNHAEWAEKDPKGYEKANSNNVSGISISYEE